MKVFVFSTHPEKLVRPLLLMDSQSRDMPEHPRGASWTFIQTAELGKDKLLAVNVDKARTDILSDGTHIYS